MDSAHEMANTIYGVIAELAPNAKLDVHPEAVLEDDLGYHSLALIELALTLEEMFDLDPITPEEAERVVTARDVVDLILQVQSANGDGRTIDERDEGESLHGDEALQMERHP